MKLAACDLCEGTGRFKIIPTEDCGQCGGSGLASDAAKYAKEARRRSAVRRATENMPQWTGYFCGSCGAWERDQDHAPDCVFDERRPRVQVVYVPMEPQP